MKFLYILVLACVFSCTSYLSQTSTKNYPKSEDMLYVRKRILDTICEKLNKLHKYYFPQYPKLYEVLDENFYNFYIYDMIDTLNITPNKRESCIEFKNNHIYHIGSLRSMHGISLILILSEGKLYFFEGLNCCEKINTIEEVINWIEKEIPNKLDKIAIKRIKNFKKYKKDFSIDKMGKKSRCECEDP